MALPAIYTKGANSVTRSRSAYQRKRLGFSVEKFDQVVRQVEALLAKAGAEFNPEAFYPPVKVHKGKSRDLPMVDSGLRESIIRYLEYRLAKNPGAKPGEPLFITQKRGPYSPNTLQEHMAMMLREWAGVEEASSHSGRRSLITDIIHKQGKPLKITQKVTGHKNEATEEEISSQFSFPAPINTASGSLFRP